jgi:hypothetical protein
MDSPLDDELTSINSIYGPGTLDLVDEAARVCTLSFASSTSVILRLEFPANYPDAPPLVLGTESVGAQLRKGVGAKIVDATRVALTEVYRPGQSCMYDLIEEMNALLDDRTDLQAEAPPADDAPPAADEPSAVAAPEGNGGGPADWTVGAPLTEKKSVFVARAARAASPAEARGFLAHLLASDKKAARATHNVIAWRIRGPDGTSYQDSDDDGETAAGGRLLHLLRVMDCWDVCVVISRWYGGVKLGPDRFRIMNSVARDVLVAGGFASK